jgi:uncharacterized protein YndB with AHSA1/START domain
MDDTATYGTLTRTGEQSELRFVRELGHDLATVWRALTDDAELAQWFPTTIEGERRAGAPLRFGHRNVDAPAFTGRMLAYDPPRLIEIEWGTDVVRIELEPTATGCRLTLTDGFVEHGKAARDGGGWHACLDALEDALAGRAPRDDRWGEVHPQYVERFGPDAATIGPPGA